MTPCNGQFFHLGITEKLGHLKDIGVEGIWLSPIFKSPMADFGYDISDFRSIDPFFGSMEDFDRLLEKAKILGDTIRFLHFGNL
jgi:alpha-glucosidase